MPRLALVKNTFLPPSETFVYQQLCALRRYEPLLFVRELAGGDRFPPRWPCSELAAGGLAERLAYMLRGRAGRFERDAARWRPDIVHAHFGVDGVYALGLAESLQVPLVVTLHAYDIVKLPRVPSRHLAWWMHALRHRELQRRADAFVVISAAMREAALAKGYPADRLHLIPLGVNLAAFQPPATREDGGPLRLLHVGRLVEKKGLAVLLAALEPLVAGGRDVRLTVIGDGPLRSRLERRAAALGDRVRFLGAQPPATVRAEMAAAQVFCLPSRRDRQGDQEGLPVALMEAAAMGMAVVASAHSGIVELVESEASGLLVPEGDAVALAAALARLDGDPALRGRLGAGARQAVAARHDLHRQTAQLEELFDAVLERRRPRATAAVSSRAPASAPPPPAGDAAGFRLQCRYTDAAGLAMGARWLHARTGFLVDLLEIESVPQGFFWVKTLARTDRGEAHACEHLLLGKGAKGRAVAALEEMTLSTSSAWTGQLGTAYHFHTLAGEEGFLRNLEARLDALLHPDFSDEEIRREVAHVVVVEDAATGRLALEEKGTVFTEMMSSMEGPSYPLWTGIAELLYGPGHVQATNAGGRPETMRGLTPADLRAFHAEFYRPSGMGLIASLPAALPPQRLLAALEGMLGRLAPDGAPGETSGIQTLRLPPAAPRVAPGALVIRSYPSQSATSPAQAVFAWPARLDLDPDEIGLVELFLDSLAGGPGTPLYAALIASRSRVLRTGASTVFGYHSDEPGHPLMIGLSGLAPEGLDPKRLAAIRRRILDVLRAVHAWTEGDPALAAFNREAASRLAAQRKEARQALDRPPMFGFRRGHADYWHSLLGLLERQSGAEKSLVLEARFAALEAALREQPNPWRAPIERWGLLEPPVGLAVLPEPGLLEAAAAGQAERLAAFRVELTRRLGGAAGRPGDEQAALAAYRREVEAASAALEAAAAAEPIPEFVEAPPLGLDEELAVESASLPGGVPLVIARFEHLSTATLGLAFRLDVAAESQLHLLPLLPDLVARAGLVLEGELLDTASMQERLRHELTGYAAYVDANPQSGRVELVLRAAAAGPAERARLLPWLDAALRHPYLAPDNLPRLRDLAAQEFSRLRTRMQTAEEGWVVEPAAAYRHQRNPVYLSVACFLTELHHALRLQWLLAEPGDAADCQALAAFLDALATAADAGAEALAALCARRPVIGPTASPAAGTLAVEILDALGALLPELPANSLTADWRELCHTLRGDLLTPPAATLAALRELLAALPRADNCRVFLIANETDRRELLPALETWAAGLGRGPSRRAAYAERPHILERFAARRPQAAQPTYVGLLDANTHSGTLLFSARSAAPWSAERENLLDALAAACFGGGGGHGLFMRTWAAGLAYSNGFSHRPRSGLLSYYAERCSDVGETLRFAARVIAEGEVSEALLGYALAVAFNQSRAAGPFEQRGEAMAADLADGCGPERVRAFRRGLLALRKEPGLAATLAARLPTVYGQVLIGLGRPLKESREGVYFLIGPEAQFLALEALIAAAEAPTEVARLAPRDFWLVSSPPAGDS